jgi:hypothetical protein
VADGKRSALFVSDFDLLKAIGQLLDKMGTAFAETA